MNMISATPSRRTGATLPAISQQIWDEKYRLKTPAGEPMDLTVEDSWRRVSRVLASVENDPAHWEAIFDSALQDFKFLPVGRILAGAGVSRRVTLFNCFVMGTIEDDLDAIFSHLREAALTMQHGGGIGYDFSTLRPKGALVKVRRGYRFHNRAIHKLRPYYQRIGLSFGDRAPPRQVGSMASPSLVSTIATGFLDESSPESAHTRKKENKRRAIFGNRGFPEPPAAFEMTSSRSDRF